MRNARFRSFKTIRSRIAFSLVVGLVIAFASGGWLPLVEPKARTWNFAPMEAVLWIACAGMVFLVSILVDE